MPDRRRPGEPPRPRGRPALLLAAGLTLAIVTWVAIGRDEQQRAAAPRLTAGLLLLVAGAAALAVARPRRRRPTGTRRTGDARATPVNPAPTIPPAIRRHRRTRWVRRLVAVAVAGTVLVGFAQWRHAEDLRTDAQVRTLVRAVLGVGTQQAAVPATSPLLEGFRGGFQRSGTVADALADLRASVESASLDGPFCLAPSERTLGILRTVEPTLVDAATICEVRRGRQHWGRVVIRILDDETLSITYALGPRSATDSLRRSFPDEPFRRPDGSG